MSPPPEPPAPAPSSAGTIGAVVANAARGAPEATAAIIDDHPHTFTDLDKAGSRVAHQLVAAGIAHGDVALVVSETSFDLLASFVGCARAGVVFAPINPALDAATIADSATRIGAAIALVSPQHQSAAAALPVAVTARWFEAEAEADVEVSPVSLPVVQGHDPHVAFFTSGSTGTPKAAVLSHQTSMLRSHPGSQLEPRGPALCPYPLFHMGGWTITLQQWHARAPVVFVEGTDAATLADALCHHNIERFNAIPALWSRLGEHWGADTTGALPHLRFADTGTSPTSAELLESIVAMAPNAHVRVFYGSTEAGNVTSLHHDDLLAVPGSCGQPSVLTELALSEEGELLISGPLLFDGYLNDPDATAAAFTDGWFHSGDRAHIDDAGFVHILGRLGTVIRTGGESVVPETVEAEARNHHDVDDIAVFGVPDEKWGETVWAAVVTTKPVSLKDLRAHLGAAGLPSYAHPRHLLHLDAIPRTAASGQVDRHRLRQLAARQP